MHIEFLTEVECIFSRSTLQAVV